MADELNPDFANKLKEALLGSKKEMKELYQMGQLYNKALGGAADEASKYNKLLGSQRGLVTAIANQAKLQVDENGELVARTEKQIALVKTLKDISASTNDIADARNRLQADLLVKQQMLQNGLTGEYAEQAKNYALLLQTGELKQGQYDMYIDQLKQQQEETTHLQEQLDLTEEIANKQLEILEEADSWKNKYNKISETAKAIARDPKVMGAFMFNEAVKGVEKFHESFEEFKKQGLSAGQAVQAQFKGLSLESMLGLSDTKGVMNGVIEQYGNVNALSRDTVNELGKMAVHFGISGEEAAKLNASLSQMPGETAETAAHAMEHVGHMAEMQGIAPGTIMKDMASNTEAMALYGSRGAQEFGKSAIELRKMGMSIDTAAKMASSLLNFESSINAQTEASVLLGRELNFDKARQLSLEGDLVGAAKEVVAQAGGEHQWAQMNVLQKQKLAEAAGMTVEEMQKQIDAQKEHNKYFGEEAGLLDNTLGYLMEYGGKAAGFFKENGMLLMTSIQFMQNMGILNMKDFAAKVKNFAVQSAHWIKQKAQWVLEKAQAAWRFMTGAKEIAQENAIAAAKQRTAAADKMKGGGGIGKTANGIGKIKIGSVLAGAAALVLVAAAVWVFGKAVQEFTKVSWGDIGKAVVGMLALVGALALIGAIMSSGVGAVAILAGAGAMILMAAAVLVLGIAVQQLAKGFDMFVPALLQLAPMAKEILMIGTGLALMGAGVLALAYSSFIAAPGLMLLGIGLALVYPLLRGIADVAAGGMLPLAASSLIQMASAAPGLAVVAFAMLGIAGGLTAIAFAGLAALPIIGALIALAAVAPALAGIGASLGGVFGGGGNDEKMDILISKIDQLIAVAASGGEVKMDGKKVGEIVRLGINSSGVR